MPALFGHAAREAVTSVNNRPVSVDAELDPATFPARRSSEVRRLPRCRCIEGVRRDQALPASSRSSGRTIPLLPGSGNFWSRVRSGGDSPLGAARYTTVVGDVSSSLASAAKTISATYKYQYNGHMPIGPTCSIADVNGELGSDLLQLAGSGGRTDDPRGASSSTGSRTSGFSPLRSARSSTKARAP